MLKQRDRLAPDICTARECSRTLNQPVDALGIHGLYKLAVRSEEVVGAVDACEVPAMAVDRQFKPHLSLTEHDGDDPEARESVVLQSKRNILRIGHGLDILSRIVLKAHIKRTAGGIILHDAVQVILLVGDDHFFVKSLDRGQVKGLLRRMKGSLQSVKQRVIRMMAVRHYNSYQQRRSDQHSDPVLEQSLIEDDHHRYNGYYRTDKTCSRTRRQQ